ncbi:MAG: hypothetical protein K0S65_4800 [Labilithrix sp.]|nr:hypothetical protein [Labilithrix sp.]
MGASARGLLRRPNIMRALFDAALAGPEPSREDTVPPSQRLTFDMAVVASVAGLTDSRGNVPLHMCVPYRTAQDPPATITAEQIYVLLYVDGTTTLAEIAEETSYSLSDTIAIVLGLFTQGLVAFEDGASPHSQRILKTTVTE